MALSAHEVIRFKYFMGYPAIQSYTDELDDTIYFINADINVETEVRSVLLELDNIFVEFSGYTQYAVADRLNTMYLNKSRHSDLARLGRFQVSRLAVLTGVSPKGDVFGDGSWQGGPLRLG